MNIPFNKPYITGSEINCVEKAISNRRLSGDGPFTKQVHQFFEDKYNFNRTFLTTSCTDALEMSAILANISPGDQVIMPSYTFVSTANAFVLRGADIKFVDSTEKHPNMDANKVEELITSKTKALVLLHYAGVACDIDKLLGIAQKHNLIVIEDAAHSVSSYYKGKPLGSFGDLSTLSFHETKNIISGEGGLLCVNNNKLGARAEIIREKGTNRSQFFRGEIDKYGWIDVGSSYLASELIAAFLMGQLSHLEKIQSKRVSIWERYYKNLGSLFKIDSSIAPFVPEYAFNNAHMFYMKCRSLEERTSLIKHLSDKGIKTAFHYSSLHSSDYFKQHHDGRSLPNADAWSLQLLRLPLFVELKESEIDFICKSILDFYNV